MPDQSGRTWFITGATSGLGREAARAASRAGARLIVPARNPEKARALLQELPGPARTLPLDLGDLASVRAAAVLIDELIDEPIDILLNNAGRVTMRREQNAAGHELILATNLLGPFAFTNLIADRVRQRIVIVGSSAHRVGHVDGHDPHFRRRRWSAARAYSQAKLGDMLWAVELYRRLRAAGRDLTVQLAHPGWALTGIQNVSASQRLNRVFTRVSGIMSQPAEVGALPILMAATADLPPLSYCGPDGLGEQRGAPTLVGRAWRALDPQAARAVWELCVRDTGTDLPMPSAGED
nr:SDR family NAD(P)-dependent oxidoreductase [Kineosphaera limosa]